MDDLSLQVKAASLVLRPIATILVVVVAYSVAKFCAGLALQGGGDKSTDFFKKLMVAFMAIAFAAAIVASVDAVFTTLNPTMWHAVFSGEAAGFAHRKGWI